MKKNCKHKTKKIDTGQYWVNLWGKVDFVVLCVSCGEVTQIIDKNGNVVDKNVNT
jgi:hypothetical protein